MSANQSLSTQTNELLIITNPEVQDRFVSVVEAIVNHPELAKRYDTGFLIIEDRRAGDITLFSTLFQNFPIVYTELNSFMKASFVNKANDHHWSFLIERNTFVAIEKELKARTALGI